VSTPSIGVFDFVYEDLSLFGIAFEGPLVWNDSTLSDERGDKIVVSHVVTLEMTIYNGAVTLDPKISLDRELLGCFAHAVQGYRDIFQSSSFWLHVQPNDPAALDALITNLNRLIGIT